MDTVSWTINSLTATFLRNHRWFTGKTCSVLFHYFGLSRAGFLRPNSGISTLTTGKAVTLSVSNNIERPCLLNLVGKPSDRVRVNLAYVSSKIVTSTGKIISSVCGFSNKPSNSPTEPWRCRGPARSAKTLVVPPLF